MKKVFGIFSLLYKIYIALVFVLTLCVFYLPIVIILSKEKWKQKAHPIFVTWSRCMQILIFIRFKINLKAPLPEGNVIICANHSSYMDIILLPALMKKYPLFFVGKYEVLKYPFVKNFFKNYHIPVNRNNRMQSARSFVKIDRAFKAGWSIVIFPEGGIPDTNRPKMMSFKNGAFKLAMDNKASILPITFLNHYKLLSDPSDILGSAHPGISKVVIHKVITEVDYNNLSIEELKQKVFNTINEPIQQLY